MTIGHPLSRFARVIEIEHRCDGVHTQAVDVVLVEPEQRIGDEKIPHLVASVVENIRPPIAVLALPRIGMLVQMRAVEHGQSVRVLGKMRGHPVEDHAKSGFVAAVDKMPEIIRVAEAAGGREVAGHLVAPRAVERMLRHGHQLEMREAHLQAVGKETIRQLQIAERTIVLLDHALPRAEVHFVNADRFLVPFLRGPIFHPRIVRPGKAL